MPNHTNYKDLYHDEKQRRMNAEQQLQKVKTWGWQKERQAKAYEKDLARVRGERDRAQREVAVKEKSMRDWETSLREKSDHIYGLLKRLTVRQDAVPSSRSFQ
jgi:predicted  nucleic acid-binding Zn-ribbon protein